MKAMYERIGLAYSVGNINVCEDLWDCDGYSAFVWLISMGGNLNQVILVSARNHAHRPAVCFLLPFYGIDLG